MKLTPADYARAAQLLGCLPAAIRAVAAVESAGDGFLPDGRPKILFEAHIFSRLTGHRFDATNPQVSSPTWNKLLYIGGAGEHARLDQASALDANAALSSASWGKFQLMGFNYTRCGFDVLNGLDAFVAAMRRDEGAQLTAFCHFVKSMRLDDELRRGDWAGFARGFNGPNYAENRYDERLAKAFGNFHPIDTTMGVNA